jgi:hypothetical protein
MDNNDHFLKLKMAYQMVGNRTWLDKDFSVSNLDSSRNLFLPESLALRLPRPKALEVYALLSGLSFEQDFCKKLMLFQMKISEVLGSRMHYWVLPNNFGLEHCVFKWPTDEWNKGNLTFIKNFLSLIKLQSFAFHIRGIQINPDGCVVAKGYDEAAEIFRLRTLLKDGVPFLPERQSAWAHVPLGRILEPLGENRFEKLKRLINEISEIPICSVNIDIIKIIHETRWYMEERNTLAEYELSKDRL